MYAFNILNMTTYIFFAYFNLL